MSRNTLSIIRRHYVPAWLVVLGVLSCLLVPSPSRAKAVVTRISTERSSGVTIEVTTPYEKLPAWGTMPARVHISNHSGKARTWTLMAESSTYAMHRQTYSWSHSFTVEDQAEGDFEVLLPMATLFGGPYQYPSLRLQVVGYGSRGYSHTISPGRGGGHGHRSSGPSDEIYRAVSDQWLAACRYFATNAIPNSSTLDFRVSLPDLSTHPQAYQAIDQVWLTAPEWKTLSAAKQQALAQWVRLGGELVIATSPGDELFALPPGIADTYGVANYGFGRIRTVSLKTKAMTKRQIGGIDASTHSRYSLVSSAQNAKVWKLRQEIGSLLYPMGLILMFTILFAVLLGPVNLIIAKRRGRVAQMLWTTPVFALVASLLLTVVILCRDGLGGKGLRTTLAYLDPASHTLSTLQEQVSLTGVLLNNGFSLDADTSIIQLQTEGGVDRRNRRYTQQGDYRSGSWFGSRSIQAQLLERVQPTRERVERVAASNPDDPPTLQSAVGYPLYNLYYRDQRGRLWYTSVLNTGERKPLESSSPAAFRDWWSAPRAPAAAGLGMAFSHLENQPNMFYADVREDKGLAIETLPSIRWKNRGAVLAGPTETQGAL